MNFGSVGCIRLAVLAAAALPSDAAAATACAVCLWAVLGVGSEGLLCIIGLPHTHTGLEELDDDDDEGWLKVHDALEHRDLSPDGSKENVDEGGCCCCCDL